MSRTERSSRPPLGRKFLIVWLGQTVSEVGTMLSAVGAAIWVFVETGSAVWLGILSALAALPYVLIAPLGSMVDRLPRRRVMIGADVVAALGPLAALGLAAAGQLEVWHLVASGFVGGLGNALQIPASQAAVPALVPASALDRANSLKQLGPAIGIVVGPALAAPIVVAWGVEALLMIDVATFLVGVTAVSVVRFDDHRDAEPAADDGSWATMWAWLSTDGRALLTLMGAGAIVNFALALFNVSLLALATDVAGPARAGAILGLGGGAMLVGSVVAAARGLGSDRIATMVRSLSALAVGLGVSALRPSFAIVAVGAAIAMAAVPAAQAASSTIYNELVPASMQGRVFAVRGAIGQSLQPLGAALAGVIITHLASPAISDGGSLAPTLGGMIGTGPERGTAVVILACAVSLGIVALWLHRSTAARALRPTSDVDESPRRTAVSH